MRPWLIQVIGYYRWLSIGKPMVWYINFRVIISIGISMVIKTLSLIIYSGSPRLSFIICDYQWENQENLHFKHQDVTLHDVAGKKSGPWLLKIILGDSWENPWDSCKQQVGKHVQNVHSPGQKPSVRSRLDVCWRTSTFLWRRETCQVQTSRVSPLRYRYVLALYWSVWWLCPPQNCFSKQE